MAGTVAHWYSSDLSNKYQHDTVKVIMKCLCYRTLDKKVDTGPQGLNVYHY